MKNKEKELKKMVKKLDTYSSELAETLEITDDTNKQGQDKYSSINEIKSRVDSTLDFCRDALNNPEKLEEDGIDKIDFAVNSVMNSSPTLTRITEESKQVNTQVVAHVGTINATIPIVASGTTWFADYSMNQPDVFPNRGVIVEKYKIKNELKDNIAYVKSQLPKIKKFEAKCDISEEFEDFVRTFQSKHPSEEKYQYLSSCRAMIFGRLVLRYQWRKFGKPKDHREAIINFITNGKTLDSPDEFIVKDFLDLYEELSQRYPNEPSIKKGRNITAQYNEQLFGKIIGYMSALLRLREKYTT